MMTTEILDRIAAVPQGDSKEERLERARLAAQMATIWSPTPEQSLADEDLESELSRRHFVYTAQAEFWSAQGAEGSEALFLKAKAFGDAAALIAGVCSSSLPPVVPGALLEG